MVLLTKHHWYPIQEVIDWNVRRCQDKMNQSLGTNIRVLEIGPGSVPFPLANVRVDVQAPPPSSEIQVIPMDVDKDLYLNDTDDFIYGYARHVFEDLQNPDFAFREMTRVCQNGYIETPSPLIECLKNVDCFHNVSYRGYVHHRYIIWTEKGILHMLPKFPILEHLQFPPFLEDHWIQIANDFPLFWNNYYTWSKPHSPPQCKIYKHGLDFQISRDYYNLVCHAVEQSIQETQMMVEQFQQPRPTL